MAKLVISEDSGAKDLGPLALALNEVVKLPVTLRSAKSPGIRVEKGRILNDHYTGPVLEEVIRTGKPIRTIPQSGDYKGVPVSVAPISSEGKILAAVGIVDVMGTVDLPEIFGHYSEVVRQVQESR